MTFTARDLDIDDLMRLKPRGFYRIETSADGITITVCRAGKPIEIIRCLSPGHVNQVRQRLTENGLTGLIEASA